MTPRHIGIVACSAEGAALCYCTICIEGAAVLGPHAHPEVMVHTPSLANYMASIYRSDWVGVGELMLASAHKLKAVGADFLICPDNTIHQALPQVVRRSPLPWLHIAEEVASEAVVRDFKRLAITGTRWLVDSEVYPDALTARGLAYMRPTPEERDEINRIIMNELVCGLYKPGGKREVQIDECRVPTSGEDMGDPARANRLGRWPANVCHDGSDEVLAAFAAFGKDKGAFAPVRGHEPSHTGDNGIYHRFERVPGPFFGDTGTVARFFYCAKAGKADRTGSKHPTVKPIELLKWLVALVTPKNGLVLDCFAGSGTTAIAARATGRNAVLIEKESEYVADIRRRLAQNADRHSAVVKNRNRVDVQGTLP